MSGLTRNCGYPDLVPGFFTFVADTNLAGGTGSDTFTFGIAPPSTYPPPLTNGPDLTNCVIDWGDGSSDVVTTYNDPVLIHVYPAPGKYNIQVSGEVWPHNQNNLDAPKMLVVRQLGPVRLADASFWGCSNMTYTATDAPDLSQTDRLIGCFSNCAKFNGYVNNWDVGGIKFFIQMFGYCDIYNQPLDAWDMREAVEIRLMFFSCPLFNQPLNNWVFNNMNACADIFYFASSFNQPLSNWNMSKVLDIAQMFVFASEFNQNLNSWTSPAEVLVIVKTGRVPYKVPVRIPIGAAIGLAGAFVTGDTRLLAGTDVDLSAWDVSNATTLLYFLETDLSPVNYDLLLNAWSLLTVNPGLTVDMAGSKYSPAAAAARSVLTSAPNNWVINDGGPV